MVYGSTSHNPSGIENSGADLPDVVAECKAIPTRMASLAQLAEHALRKRMVMGSIPIGGFFSQGAAVSTPQNRGW